MNPAVGPGERAKPKVLTSFCWEWRRSPARAVHRANDGRTDSKRPLRTLQLAFALPVPSVLVPLLQPRVLDVAQNSRPRRAVLGRRAARVGAPAARKRVGVGPAHAGPELHIGRRARRRGDRPQARRREAARRAGGRDGWTRARGQEREACDGGAEGGRQSAQAPEGDESARQELVEVGPQVRGCACFTSSIGS